MSTKTAHRVHTNKADIKEIHGLTVKILTLAIKYPYAQSDCMKLYGKPSEMWNDSKFRTIIENALSVAAKHKKPYYVMQDADGAIMITDRMEDHLSIFACVATALNDKAFQDGKIDLIDNVAYHTYSVDEMIPRIRNVLTSGIVEYGGLRFLSEGRIQLSKASECAFNLAKLHDKPFILGLTKNGIMIAPLSEKSNFLDVASCVVTKNGFWSMSDKLPVGGSHWVGNSEPLVSNSKSKCSIRIGSPSDHVYCGILESKGVWHDQ